MAPSLATHTHLLLRKPEDLEGAMQTLMARLGLTQEAAAAAATAHPHLLFKVRMEGHRDPVMGHEVHPLAALGSGQDIPMNS